MNASEAGRRLRQQKMKIDWSNDTLETVACMIESMVKVKPEMLAAEAIDLVRGMKR